MSSPFRWGSCTPWCRRTARTSERTLVQRSDRALRPSGARRSFSHSTSQGTVSTGSPSRLAKQRSELVNSRRRFWVISIRSPVPAIRFAKVGGVGAFSDDDGFVCSMDIICLLTTADNRDGLAEFSTAMSAAEFSRQGAPRSAFADFSEAMLCGCEYVRRTEADRPAEPDRCEKAAFDIPSERAGVDREKVCCLPGAQEHLGVMSALLRVAEPSARVRLRLATLLLRARAWLCGIAHQGAPVAAGRVCRGTTCPKDVRASRRASAATNASGDVSSSRAKSALTVMWSDWVAPEPALSCARLGGMYGMEVRDGTRVFSTRATGHDATSPERG